MKKALLLVFMISIFGGSCIAQNYQIYIVKGEVKFNNGTNETTAVAGMKIQADTKVTVPDGGRLVILDEANMKLQTIKTASSETIAELLKKDDVSVQQLTESYLSYIKSKMTNSGDPKDNNYRQSAGTSYRDPDSLLLQSLFPEDTLKNSTNQ